MTTATELNTMSIGKDLISALIDGGFCHGWFGDVSEEFRTGRRAQVDSLYNALMVAKHSFYNIGEYCGRGDLLVDLMKSIRDDREVVQFQDRQYIDVVLCLLKAGEYSLADYMFQELVLPKVKY